MSETVAKERIGEAMDLLEASKGVSDRVQLVGLIDLARDELSRALKEAKERQGMAKKQRAMRGQKALPLKDSKPKVEPEGAVGVNGEGVVITPADVAEEPRPQPVEGPANFAGRDPGSPLAGYSLKCPQCGSLRYETPEHGAGDVCGLALVPGGCQGVLEPLHPRVSDGLPTEEQLAKQEAQAALDAEPSRVEAAADF